MIYPYLCKACGATFEVIKPLAEMERPEPCRSCGDLQTHRTPAVSGFTNSDSLGRRKAPTEFRDFLKKIHKDTPGSRIAENTDVN